MSRFARIDYGYGIALFWGDFTKATVEREFYRFAGQCFGIRKSISQCRVLEIGKKTMPDVLGVSRDEMTTLLKHNGDTIAWNGAGDKIRSEFD